MEKSKPKRKEGKRIGNTGKIRKKWGRVSTREKKERG